MEEKKKDTTAPSAALLRYSTELIPESPSYWLAPCISIQHPQWMIPICFARGSLLHDPIQVEQARSNWKDAVELAMKTDWKNETKLIEHVLPLLHSTLVKGMLEAKRVGWRKEHTIRFRDADIFQDVDELGQVFSDRDLEVYNSILQSCRAYKKKNPQCKQPFQSIQWTREQWTVLRKLGFVPVDPEQVMPQMTKFVQELQSQLKGTKDAFEGLKLAVWAHHQLSAIQPFAWQGNGRLARLVSGALLLRFGFLPPIHHPKSEYLHAVARGHSDFGYLVAYFVDQIRQVHKWMLDPVTGQLMSGEAYMKQVERILDTPVARPDKGNKKAKKQKRFRPTLDDVAATLDKIAPRRSERLKKKVTLETTGMK